MSRWISLAAVVVVGLVAACTTSTDPSALQNSSRRGSSNANDDNTDDTSTTTSDGGGVTTTTDASTTPVDASPPPVHACTGFADAPLCFTFEGDTKSAGTLQPTVLTGVNFQPGHENMAASLTAGSEFTFAPSAALELPTDAATIEAWVKRAVTGDNAVIFDDDGRFSLTITSNGVVLCQSSGGAVTGKTVVSTEWQHVACVVDAGTLHAYLNGAEDGSGPGSIAPNPTLTASLGANAPQNDLHFVGLIDSFRLLKVARTAAQIKDDAKP